MEGSIGTSALEFMLLGAVLEWALDAPSGRENDGLGC